MSTTVVIQDAGLRLPFTAVELTQSINTLPPQFGQMARDGMFPIEPLASAYIEIVSEGGAIYALPITDEGRPATIARRDKGQSLIFKIPNITHEDSVLANDIRNWLAAAQRTRRPETLVNLVNKRLEKLRRKFDLTLELLRVSALAGKIVDGGGGEVYDLFTAFSVVQQIVYFDLGNAATDVNAKCGEVIDIIGQNLNDESMNGVVARVSPGFFNKLVAHKSVRELYLNTVNALALAAIVRTDDGQYRPREFAHGGILFREYNAKIPMADKSLYSPFPGETGVAHPDGTLDSHVTYAAPPLDIRELDGEPAEGGSDEDLIHISEEPLKHGRGLEWAGQMNALPIWRRPATLVKLDAGVKP